MSSSPISAGESPVVIGRSRTGELYAEAGGVRIHSAYDPRREARRFLETQMAGDVPSTWVVLGEALGHLTAAIRERFPRARVVPICYDRRLAGPGEELEWTPASSEGIDSFFDRTLGELEIEGLKVIEWAPSAAAFPREAERAKAALAQAVREISGSVTTTRAFGLRWARNSLANFLGLDGFVDARPSALQAQTSRAAVVAASGPSLSEALPLITSVREKVLLVSLPSSLAALAAAGLRPDLLVATDGGSWASLHLAQIPRLPPGKPLPIAMPLSAARGAWQAGGPVLLLAQDSLFERELLATSGLSALPIASHGTVAAAAIALALLLTRGPVVLAGLDLCFRDILEHARPHSFDPLWEGSRLAPAYGALFRRAVDRTARKTDSAGARTSTAFRAYAGWLSGLSNNDRRLFRLNPSPVALPGLTPVDQEEFRRLVGKPADSERAAGIHLRSAAALSHAERPTALGAVLRRLEERLATGRRTLLASRPSDDTDAGDLPLPAELGEILYELDTAGLFEAKRAARLDGYEAARRRLLASVETVESRIAGMRSLYLK